MSNQDRNNINGNNSGNNNNNNNGENSMVVSQNKATSIWTPIYYSPYYGDPQNATPNFGKPPYLTETSSLRLLAAPLVMRPDRPGIAQPTIGGEGCPGQALCEQLSKFLVSPLITPIVVPSLYNPSFMCVILG